MARKPIPKSTQTSIILNSRRRCCICFGLNRDTSLKSGQIAHLDRNNSNNAEDNLAFLCLEHHDEYDSTTSQRKGLTNTEVKQYRTELHREIGRAFSIEVHFGAVTLPRKDPYAGQYIRLGAENDSAEIELTPLPDSLEGLPRYAVSGFALSGIQRPTGPNIGDLSFIGILDDGTIEYTNPEGFSPTDHLIRMKFDGDRMSVDDENYFGVYGVGVHFGGEYQRAR